MEQLLSDTQNSKRIKFWKRKLFLIPLGFVFVFFLISGTVYATTYFMGDSSNNLLSTVLSSNSNRMAFANQSGDESLAIEFTGNITSDRGIIDFVGGYFNWLGDQTNKITFGWFESAQIDFLNGTDANYTHLRIGGDDVVSGNHTLATFTGYNDTWDESGLIHWTLENNILHPTNTLHNVSIGKVTNGGYTLDVNGSQRIYSIDTTNYTAGMHSGLDILVYAQPTEQSDATYAGFESQIYYNSFYDLINEGTIGHLVGILGTAGNVQDVETYMMIGTEGRINNFGGNITHAIALTGSLSLNDGYIENLYSLYIPNYGDVLKGVNNSYSIFSSMDDNVLYHAGNATFGGASYGTRNIDRQLKVVGDFEVGDDGANYVLINSSGDFYTTGMGIFDGKVGIGTATPTHELNVVGDVNVTEDGYIGDDLYFKGTTPRIFGPVGTDMILAGGDIASSLSLYGHYSAGASAYMNLYGQESGGVGDSDNGMISFVSNIEGTHANAGNIRFMNYNGSAWDTRYQMLKDGSHEWYGNESVSRMRIDSAGKVGIGTSSPTHALNVVGVANITKGIISPNITLESGVAIKIGANNFYYSNIHVVNEGEQWYKICNFTVGTAWKRISFEGTVMDSRVLADTDIGYVTYYINVNEDGGDAHTISFMKTKYGATGVDVAFKNITENVYEIWYYNPGYARTIHDIHYADYANSIDWTAFGASTAGQTPQNNLPNLNQNFYNDFNVDGNVGIGTTTPTHELNVVGDANITSQLFVGGPPFSGVATAITGKGTYVGVYGSNDIEDVTGSLALVDYGVYGTQGDGDYAGFFEGHVHITADLYSATESSPWSQAREVYNTTDINLLKKIETYNKTGLPEVFYREERAHELINPHAEVKTTWNIWKIIKLMQGSILEVDTRVSDLEKENELMKERVDYLEEFCPPPTPPSTEV